ncbi:MAG: hypothetical protein CL551_14595 [Alcanivorax sp.]|nr:hypothetical protein [Alcanivorax sp.]MBI55511.1 hypothetical protein [Alcanivorax sp.]HCE41212.1 hypothetical protein [Alcanivorax sp.]|tara:strand:- start:80 stop:409 length:330 start_codon:yes stop_codon:yes gene_type:complete
MKITFDAAKRQRTLIERGLDFADAAKVFGQLHFTFPDQRARYPEPRFISIGYLGPTLVVLVWTPKDAGYRVISMRKANERERKRFQKALDGSGRRPGNHRGDAGRGRSL